MTYNNHLGYLQLYRFKCWLIMKIKQELRKVKRIINDYQRYLNILQNTGIR